MKRFLLFALAVIMFAACSKDAINEQQNMQTIVDEAPETLVVGFEESDETRIQLNEAQKTVWTKGDLVSVFYRSDANQKWQYTGETGVRIAELTRVDEGVATEEMKRVVVVYPYNDDYYINTETYNIQAFLPAVQTYLRDSYGLNGNIMISQSEYNNFSLKSVCGWLKLQLTGNGEKVKSITLRGNNGEQVAGELYINSADATATLSSDTGSADDGETGGAGGGLVFEDTILKEITLDCGEGVALGKEATAFYIALPPQTFKHGFTVEIEDTEGYVMEKSTDKALIIERNHIQPMAAFEFINPNGPAQPTPTSNEIWYTSSNGKVVTPYKTNVFGATIISNEYNNGMGVITFDGDVTSIGDYAFEYCRSLTSVNIPDSVTTIGDWAFAYCESLTSVNIPNSVTTIGYYAFSNCSSLKEFTGKLAEDNGRILVIDGVLTAFVPAGITEYTIPDSVTTIGEMAFYYCTNLTSVNIPDSVTTIGYNAFAYCTSLTSVNIPDSVTTIGQDAFQNCTSLTSVNIPDSVTTIGYEAFYNCTSLTSVNIPDSVTTIGYNAFAYCTSLTSVNIPDSVTSIGNYTFSHCRSLTSVNIPDSVTTIGYEAFRDCTSLTSMNIPDSVTTIGHYAFYNCRSLTSVNIPDSVTTIGASAFYACTSLTSVNIPDSVTEIGGSAFEDCDSLTSVNIPDSVTTIGYSTFYSCDSLKKVYCYATIPPALGGTSVFDANGSGRKIYVPAGSVEAYKSADGWNEYADAIVGYDFENGVVVEGYGIDDSNLDHNKYLTYVANHSYLLDFESEDYYYWDTYFEHNVNGIMVAEYKFQLATTQNYTIQYISDDSIYIEGNELYVYSESYYNNYDERKSRYNTIDLTTIGIQPTDLIVLRVDAANNVVTINDQEISFNKIGAAMSYKYLFSAYDRVSDEGHAYYYDGLIDGAKLYYAKGWDSNGYLTYLGCASTDINDKTGNVEACWRAKYYNGKIVETTTFANDRYVEDYVPLGMGNM